MGRLDRVCLFGPRQICGPCVVKPRLFPRLTSHIPQSRRVSAKTRDRAGSDRKSAVSEALKGKWLPFVGSMAVAAVFGLYVSQAFIPPSKRPHCAQACQTGPMQSPREFDRELDFQEWLMGIKKLRKLAAAEATGHVLETAVGTGRNFAFYDWDGIANNAPDKSADHTMASFTGLDLSTEVLAVAMEKLQSALPAAQSLAPRVWGSPEEASGGGGISYLDGRVRLIKFDTQQETLPSASLAGVEEAKFDTILQTFGLCSVEDPKRALAAMAAAVKPNTGRILLLEHGRGASFINYFLDRGAQRHHDSYGGCWWNRDIEAIVRGAVDDIPGLELVLVRRPYLLQFGTLIWLELRVSPTE